MEMVGLNLASLVVLDVTWKSTTAPAWWPGLVATWLLDTDRRTQWHQGCISGPNPPHVGGAICWVQRMQCAPTSCNMICANLPGLWTPARTIVKLRSCLQRKLKCSTRLPTLHPVIEDRGYQTELRKSTITQRGKQVLMRCCATKDA